ncbi:MAG: tetratricopeptide repeat protein [Candidatus Omnitrophica bacterium]|nr:tetratricopeptide repeat protein [Candidatus Omnitrophota bacterium]MBU1047123.1 tetratricopeptide repeat protein [Candidatus Omnitrophota bacterium]MBU1767289.1 tetratricopeptide repeat protein [Candidatus Omnitrophota bacterium]MBU1889599.1 tetratricopeptide repeat protein [Candidatus Omnitrophota bacterium]
MKKSKKIKSAGENAVYAPPNLFNNIYIAIIILIACSTALAMMPQAFNYVLIKLAIAQFLLIIIFIIWLYNTLKEGEILIYKDPSFIALLFLTAWLILNLLTSSFMYASIREFSRLLTCFFLYFVVVNLINRRKDLIGVVACIIVVFAGLSLHGLFDHFHNKNPVIISTFGNPNFFSAYLVTILPVVILLGIYNFFRKNFFISSLLLILTIIGIYLVYILDSQGAWLALTVSVLFLLILFRRQIFKPKWRTPILTVVLALCLLGSLWSVQKLPQIKTHLEKEIATGTVGIRVNIWHGTLKMMLARPFLGWGMGTFIIVYPQFRIPEYFLNPHSVNATDHAHNEILEFASEIGLIGLGLFLWFLVIIFARAVRTFNRQSLNLLNIIHAGLIAGAIALFVHNLTCVNLRLEASAIYFYLFLGLISAVCKLYEDALKDKYPQNEENYFHKKFFTNTILLWLIIPLAILLGLIYTNGTIKLIKSSVYLKTAMVLREQNKWNEAIEQYNKAIYWDNYSLKAYYRLAFAYAAINKMDEALYTYLKLGELAPDYADIHYNLGSIYLRMGKWEDAKKRLKRAIELNSYESKIYCNLAAVYMQLGELENAFAQYTLAILIQEQKKKIDPNLADFGGGYVGLGEIYYSKNQWKEASVNYQRAMQLGEKNVKILTKLGNCYFNMQDFKKAKQIYEEVLKQDPSLTQIEEFVKRLDKIIELGENGKQ